MSISAAADAHADAARQVALLAVLAGAVLIVWIGWTIAGGLF